MPLWCIVLSTKLASFGVPAAPESAIPNLQSPIGSPLRKARKMSSSQAPGAPFPPRRVDRNMCVSNHDLLFLTSIRTSISWFYKYQISSAPSRKKTAHPVFRHFGIDSRRRPGTLSPADPWHFSLCASPGVPGRCSGCLPAEPYQPQQRFPGRAGATDARAKGYTRGVLHVIGRKRQMPGVWGQSAQEARKYRKTGWAPKARFSRGRMGNSLPMLILNVPPQRSQRTPRKP